jgi:hypothetical protein
MTTDTLAAEAASLRDNEAFQASLNAMRADALDKLATIDPASSNAIIEQQAIVKVVDNLRGNLEQFIRSGRTPKPAGIA